MWGKIKKVVSFIDDYIFGIYIVLVIVGIIMMLTAQAFVIFILGFVLVIGGHVLPFSNYKILKIASEKENEQGNYEEICRRFLADARDFREEILEKLEITNRFNNNGICFVKVKSFVEEKLMEE